MSTHAIQVFGKEIDLVIAGAIEGDLYRDGECWADALSLMYFREHGTPYHESPMFSEVPHNQEN